MSERRTPPRKARTSHPIEMMAAGVAEPAPEPVRVSSIATAPAVPAPAHTEPQTPAQRVLRSVRGGGAVTAPPVERTVRAAAPVEITPEVAAAVAPSPAPAPAATPSRSTPIPAPETADVPAEAGEGARRLKVTRRGKQGVTFSWPAEDLARVEQVYRDNRSVYRKQWRQQDPGARYELGFSAFTAHALTRALTNVNDWIGTVRNDARLEPIGAGQKQKALMWPLPLAEDLHDLWEDLEVRPGWPDGFHLTKAHLAMAGILSALPSVGEWLMQVPNDDRYQLPPAPRDT